MKNTLLLFISLFCFSGNSQNKLSSLYRIEDNFPADMKKAREFIRLTTDDRLIYNLIAGLNSPHDANYQFTVKEDKNLSFTLPFTNDRYKLFFVDYKTKKLVNEHTFYVDYAFEYYHYFPNFIYNPSLFSPASYFKIAFAQNDNNTNELVNQILINGLNDQPFEKRYGTLLKRLKEKNKALKKLKIEDIIPEDEELSSSDKIEALVNAISNEVDEELPNLLFVTFMQNKSKPDITYGMIKKIFGVESLNRVDEALTQNIYINTNQSAFLTIPENEFKTELDNNAIPITQILVQLDFKNKELRMYFKTQTTISGKVSNMYSVSEKMDIKSKNINLKQIHLRIKENEIKTIFEDGFNKQLFEIKSN
ncbi:hypothetical protein [Flavobacterium sp.]|uniref:hypothetical protein n=1 Tax=Flavobacterium sp. TaxID=239 RepID=UPI0039E3CB86